MVTSKRLPHNYSPTRTRPHIHASTYRHIFGRSVKNGVQCIVFHRRFDDGLLHTVYIHCLKSSQKPPALIFHLPCLHIWVSVLAGTSIRCRYTLLAPSTLVWQRGHLARLSFLRYEISILFLRQPPPPPHPPFRTFSLISRLQSVYSPLITGILYQIHRKGEYTDMLLLCKYWSRLVCVLSSNSTPMLCESTRWWRIVKIWYFSRMFVFLHPHLQQC